MNRTPLRTTLTLGLLAPLWTSSALAGIDPPFQVEAVAQANGSQTGNFYFDADSAPNAALTPVTASGSIVDVSSSASATFTEFAAFSQNNLSSNSNAQSFGRANDTLTIFPAGNPVGTTRLEMTWQVEGTLSGSGNQQAALLSAYRTDTAGDGNPNIFLPGTFYTTNGPVSDSVTLSYDNVPLGSPWNVRTTFSTSVSNGPGEADFASTATFVGATLFVNNVPTTAAVTGLSGQVYAVPEPTSLVLLTVGGVALIGRRRQTQ